MEFRIAALDITQLKVTIATVKLGSIYMEIILILSCHFAMVLPFYAQDINIKSGYLHTTTPFVMHPGLSFCASKLIYVPTNQIRVLSRSKKKY